MPARNAITREGGQVRKHWILSRVVAALVIGCTGALSTSAAQGAWPTQTEQMTAWQNGEVQPQKVGWTQKVSNFFKGKSAKQFIGPSKPKGRSELDPISLGYASAPPNAALYLSMAKVSDQGGNAEQARSMYQQALTLEPNNLEGMLALARLEDREGQLDAALHYYRQAVQLHPRSSQALNDLSLCFARRGQLAEALPPLEQAIRLQPSKPLYRNNLATILIELNQFDAALQHQSAVYSPAIAQYNLGVLLHQRGRDDEAMQFLARANQADPSLAVAGTLLTQLSAVTQQPAQNYAVQMATVANNSVLPTPQTSPYPTTGAVTATPAYQTVPAETARVPVGHSPQMFPPVR